MQFRRHQGVNLVKLKYRPNNPVPKFKLPCLTRVLFAWQFHFSFSSLPEIFVEHFFFKTEPSKCGKMWRKISRQKTGRQGSWVLSFLVKKKITGELLLIIFLAFEHAVFSPFHPLRTLTKFLHLDSDFILTGLCRLSSGQIQQQSFHKLKLG